MHVRRICDDKEKSNRLSVVGPEWDALTRDPERDNDSPDCLRLVRNGDTLAEPGALNLLPLDYCVLERVDSFDFAKYRCFREQFVNRLNFSVLSRSGTTVPRVKQLK